MYSTHLSSSALFELLAHHPVLYLYYSPVIQCCICITHLSSSAVFDLLVHHPVLYLYYSPSSSAVFVLLTSHPVLYLYYSPLIQSCICITHLSSSAVLYFVLTILVLLNFILTMQASALAHPQYLASPRLTWLVVVV